MHQPLAIAVIGGIYYGNPLLLIVLTNYLHLVYTEEKRKNVEPDLIFYDKEIRRSSANPK